MTNRDILKTALAQSAVDSNCRPEDFLALENRVVISSANPNARKYLELPFACDLTTYGSNIVASVSEELYGVARDYIGKFSIEQCFSTPALHLLSEKLKGFGLDVCFMAEYFLPDLDSLRPLDCGYQVRLMEPEEFAPYYQPQWGNALCEKRRHLDCLAAGAFDGEKLVGLAGCSADCDSMWQIGIDVLPAYRRQGVASCLTSRLALEILARGKVPFYCCAWANIKSARNAVKSGFRPAWAQVTAKTEAFIQGMYQNT